MFSGLYGSTILGEIIVTGLGMICLLLVIPSFSISKMLRSHPGSLVLAISLCETSRYYLVFWILLLHFHQGQTFDYDLLSHSTHLLRLMSFDIFAPSKQNLIFLALYVFFLCLRIMLLYYFFMALDLVLLLRNPFYPPERRKWLYHLVAIGVPLFILLPLSIISMHVKDENIFPEKDMFEICLDIVYTLIIGIVCVFALIYSHIKMNQIAMPKSTKYAFILKTNTYLIVGIVYCILLLGIHICYIRMLTCTEDQIVEYWQRIYAMLYLVFYICGVAILPLRISEPGVWPFILIKIKEFFKIKVNKDQKLQIENKLNEMSTYYSFLQTSMNQKLVLSILHGVSGILQQKTKENTSTNPSNKNSMIYSFNQPNTRIHNQNQFSPKEQLDIIFPLLTNGEEDPIWDSSKEEQLFGSTNEALLLNRSTYHSFLPQIQSSTFHSEISEYKSFYFLGIRKAFNITENDIIESLNIDNNKSTIFKFGEGEGKSPSTFFFTYDKKFLIKTISEGEMKLFLKMLPKYVQRVIHVSGTLLAIIFGIFSIKFHGFAPVYFILMENSLPKIQRYDLKYIFDLKGSVIQRYSRPSGKILQTLKDINFLELLSKKHILNFFPKDIKRLKLIIERDTKFLSKQNIMDYSLLLGIGKKKKGLLGQIYTKEKEKYVYSVEGKYVFYLRIIDYLQYYGMGKKAERWAKGIIKPRGTKLISSIPPKPYANRFTAFIFTKVFGIK